MDFPGRNSGCLSFSGVSPCSDERGGGGSCTAVLCRNPTCVIGLRYIGAWRVRGGRACWSGRINISAGWIVSPRHCGNVGCFTTLRSIDNSAASVIPFCVCDGIPRHLGGSALPERPQEPN